MWVVMGDEWCERQLNRREYNEDFSEQGFALPRRVRQACLREFVSSQAGRHKAPEHCGSKSQISSSLASFDPTYLSIHPG